MTSGFGPPNHALGRVAVTRSTPVDTIRIAAFPAFADVPTAELEVLAPAISELEVEPGARIVTLDEAGEAKRAVGPGDTFGEIALLVTGRRTATVVAQTPMRLLSLSGKDFKRIQAQVPLFEGSLRRLGHPRAGR